MNKSFYFCYRLYLILLCNGYTTPANSQTRTIDSLRIITLANTTAAERLKAFVLLGEERNSLNADSLKRYAEATRKLAIALHSDEALLDATLMDVSVFSKKGQTEKGLKLTEAELSKIYSIPALQHKRRRFYLSKGFILNIINKTEEAQETFFTALQEAEKENDIFVQATALNGVGWSYQNLDDNKTAVEWYKKAISVLKNGNLKSRMAEELMAILQSNIGPAYYMISQKENYRNFADTALLYLDSAITMCRQKDFTGILAISLGSKALLFSEQKNNIQKAETLLSEAIIIRKKIGQLYFIITDMGKLGELYFKMGNYTKGIAICKDAIFLADSSNIKSDILYLYDILAKNYKSSGHYKEYGDILSRQMLIRDSINKANTASSLNEIQVKYEVQKKETLIAKQEYNLFLRKLLLYGISIIALLSAVIVFIRFNKYKKNQRQKVVALLEEEKKQNVVAAKEAGEKERKRIAAELHDNLGVQANAILHNSNLLGELSNNNIAIVANLQETAKEMLLNLRETLWAMKANDIPAPELWLRIINFMKQMGRHYSTIHFETKGSVPENFILTSAKSLDIVLVIQEAVNNAVKHAHAKSIAVYSELEKDLWIIFIKDDGKGFDPAEGFAKTDSHGFENMQERALNSNFKIQFKSNPNQGSFVQLIIST